MTDVLTVSASALPQMPDDFTGITFTPNRAQPYTAWRNGRIVSYAADEITALEKWGWSRRLMREVAG